MAMAVVLADVEHRHDAGMRQLRQRAGLVLEPALVATAELGPAAA
ncbi:MAG: hypothetical protein U0168_05685 [Nannocystaceae bacterium]